jgi:hypothetical protein
VLVRHPDTGKIKTHQVQAVLEYQKREHFGYLAKFRHRLFDLAQEIARSGLSTETDIIKTFMTTSDISSVERDLITFAEHIGQPKRTLTWRAARLALLAAILPILVWVVLAVVNHANS